jgi:DNA processing protein
LKRGVFSAKKIVDTLKIDWSARKVSDFLKNRQDVLTVKGKPLKFSHKSRSLQVQKTLFD